jgi:hypothetical protein
MSNIKNWSKTPASNSSAPPDGAPEGMNPSAVNDVIRQQMADHRTQWEDAEWFDWGHVLVRQGNNSFLVSITATQIYTAGRRLKLYDSTTIYAEVVASGPSGANTLVSVSSSNLSASLSSGAVAIIDPSASSYPLNAASRAEMEAAIVTTTYTTPGRHRFSPAAAKAWGVIASGGTILDSYGIAACTKTSTGRYLFSLSATMSTTMYSVMATPDVGPGGQRTWAFVDAKTTAAISVQVVYDTGGSGTTSAVDSGVSMVVFGVQAT